MKRFLPIIVFAVVAVLGLAIAVIAYLASERANQMKFGSVSDVAMARISARFDLQVSLLKAVQAYFAARKADVSPAAFRAFVAELETESIKGGVMGVGFALLLSSKLDPSVQHEFLERYGLDRAIWPTTEEPWRTPIVLIEPLNARNSATLGYDMYVEAERREAMNRAVREGSRQATGPVLLIGQSDSGEAETGLLTFLPLFRTDVGTMVDERSLDDVSGFVFAPFRLGDMLASTDPEQTALPIHLEIHDESIGPASDPKALLFRSEGPASDIFSDGYLVEKQLDIAGRKWNMRFRPNAEFDPSFSGLISIFLGIVSVLLATALAMSALSQARALNAAAALQSASKQNLLEKDLMLQEMKHRIKNSIARVLAIARQTGASAGSTQEFMESFSSRLQAMATSQDMLTRSSWQRADLRDLLTAELKQVLGEDFDDSRLQGPSIELNETATQALGLTIHELATNALKYGALQPDGTGLDIAWTRVPGAKGAWLELDWRETGGSGVSEPEKPGFGTKLIDVTLGQELGGSVSRDYQPDGLKIAIRVPLS